VAFLLLNDTYVSFFFRKNRRFLKRGLLSWKAGGGISRAFLWNARENSKEEIRTSRRKFWDYILIILKISYSFFVIASLLVIFSLRSKMPRCAEATTKKQSRASLKFLLKEI